MVKKYKGDMNESFSSVNKPHFQSKTFIIN